MSCGEPLHLEVQVYAPVEGPRSICIFGCAACNSLKSWRVVRTQAAPSEAPPPEAPEEEPSAERAAAGGDSDGWGVGAASWSGGGGGGNGSWGGCGDWGGEAAALDASVDVTADDLERLLTLRDGSKAEPPATVAAPAAAAAAPAVAPAAPVRKRPGKRLAIATTRPPRPS